VPLFPEPAMDENSPEYGELLRAVRRAIARNVPPAAVRQAVNLVTMDYESYGASAAQFAEEDLTSEK
jgi:hypothetical protein